jgi:hypothetical protein
MIVRDLRTLSRNIGIRIHMFGRCEPSHGQYYAYTVWGSLSGTVTRWSFLYVEQTSVVRDGRQFVR